MPTPTRNQTLADLDQLADKLGIPPERMQAAVVKCPTDIELRALRRRWVEKARSLDHQYARKLRAAEQDRWSGEARAQHVRTLQEAAREREAGRKRKTWGVRADDALLALGILSSAGTTQVSPTTSRSTEGPLGPPGLRLVGDTAVAAPPTVDVSQEIVGLELIVERLERKLDAELGLVPPVEVPKLSTAEKDTMISGLVGMHSQLASELFPELGSARTIERRRVEIANERGERVVPSTGLPREPRNEEGVEAA